MCSFLFLRSKLPVSESTLRDANTFARDRGPHHTGIKRLRDRFGAHIVLLHNLLDMSGAAIHQPISETQNGGSQHLLFNGEIYNYKHFGDFAADTCSLLPAYNFMRSELPCALDGEFAFAIYDETRSQLFFAVDPFLTKPLFIGYSDDYRDFGVSTCASALCRVGLFRIEMMPANSRSLIDLDDAAVRPVFSEVFNFQLQQCVNSFDGWIEAFIESVRKRATHGAQRIAVFLSSGYDSGAICLALNLLGIKYRSLSIRSGETEGILQQRLEINSRFGCSHPLIYPGVSATRSQQISREIAESVEPFQYQHFDSPGIVGCPATDGGAIGAYFLGAEALRHNLLVNISGSGADEIISDYGHAGNRFYSHSEFGGLFPDSLEGFFPWKKFYGDTQRSYLFKDEYILGRHGLEGRYPFLDRQVVQSFLALRAELKNKEYKAPVAEFLRRYDYPFEAGAKRGFAPRSSESRFAFWLRRFGFAGRISSQVGEVERH
jgi:asparagine synthetase B (glutamine-hydrolysing)